MPPATARLRELRSRLRRPEEDIHDFLGVVQLDPDLGVLVLPDHVAAVIEVSGTDWLSESAAGKQAILEAWRNLLDSARLSLQIYIDRRPIRWDRPGGHLEQLTAQVEATCPSDGLADPDYAWQHARLEKMRRALLDGELERRADGSQLFPVPDLRQFVIIRYAMGDKRALRVPGEAPMHLPPRAEWRIWDRVESYFGGTRAVRRWRAERLEAAARLAQEVMRFQADSGRVPGLRCEKLTGLQIAQLLHLTWCGDAAYDAWIADRGQLEAILRGDDEELAR